MIKEEYEAKATLQSDNVTE